MKYWPGSSAHPDQGALGVKKKGDGTLVTKADLESNQFIVDGLTELFPEDGIYSEELGGKEDVASSRRVWIVDPLDGTKSFVQGNDDFSVLVGLQVSGAIEFGMAYFPARGCLARANKGNGAYLDGKVLSVSSSDAPRKKSIYLRHIPFENDPLAYDEWMDSGMAFLSLCRGDLDGIIIKLIHHQEWDLAAPSVLIQESGGVVTNERGEPFSFHCAPVKDQYFVASNGKIHAMLLERVRHELKNM